MFVQYRRFGHSDIRSFGSEGARAPVVGRLGPGRPAPGPLAAGYQSEPVALTTPAWEQTLPGWPFVILQIAAVSRFAAPSAPCAALLDGSCSACATWAQLMPASTPGSYDGSLSTYLLPKS